VICGGLTGSGKSFVGTGIAATLGATIAGSDRLRKQLAGIAPTARTPAEVNERVYSTRMTDRVYRRLARAAAEALQAGQPIVLDGTYLTPQRRAAPLRLAQEFGVPAAIVWCELPEAEASARLSRRGALGWAVSDGDPLVRALQRGGERPPTGDEHSARLLRVDASLPPAELFDRLMPLLRCAVASQ
jgi:predicted kinase